MARKIRLISDMPLVIFSFVFFTVTLICCSIVIWLVGHPGVVADPAEIFPIQCLFAIHVVVLLLGLIAAMTRSVCMLTFSTDGVTIHTAFQQAKMVSYKHYPYVYLGTYFHGNMIGCGLRMYYIVFSNQRITQNTLEHINELKCSHDIIKIRYTNKTYQKLRSIVPLEVRKKIDAAIGDVPQTHHR